MEVIENGNSTKRVKINCTDEEIEIDIVSMSKLSPIIRNKYGLFEAGEGPCFLPFHCFS